MKSRALNATRTRVAVLALAGAASGAALAQSASLSPIVVTASRTPTRVDQQLSDVSVLTRADLEAAGVSSMAEALSLVPGVQWMPQSIRGGNATVFLRGANHAQTLVLIDGLRVSSATTGATALQHLPLDQVERIEVLRGPASSLYGSDAMGGVIQVITRAGGSAPAASASLAAGSYGTVIGSVALSGQTAPGTDAGSTRWSLRAGGESSRGFSDIRAAKGGLYDSFNPDADGFRQAHLGASVTHRASTDLELGLGLMSTEGRKRTDGLNCDSWGMVCTAAFDNRDRQRLQTLSAHAAYQVRPGWTSTLRVGEGRDDLRSWLLDPGVPQVHVERYVTTQRQATWQNDVRMGPGLMMAALEWRGLQADTTRDLVVTRQDTGAAILGYQAWLGDHSLQASVRRDRIQRLEGSTTGTLAYGYRITPAWSARASVGTGFRAPSFNDLYWPVDYANFYQGNPALRPERSRNLEAGLAYEAGATSASITAFLNEVRDLVQITTDMVTYMSTMSNVATATLQGLSLSGRTRWNEWRLSGVFDVLSARNDATGLVLQRRVPRTATVDVSRQVDRLDVGLRLQAYSARYNDAANTQRLGGYGLLALRASYRIDRHWTLTGSITNLLDKDYVVNRGTFPPYNDYGTAGRALLVGVRYTGG